MTRAEHIQWCKDRAIAEIDYYKEPSKGLISMASDLSKHPETNSPALIQLCIMRGMQPISRQEAINFINGFN